jgi:hypothetical protein
VKDLLFKEFKLARHPTMFIFPFLGTMLLIPAYMYFTAFIYTCLTVFFIFLQGRENKDIFFTASLPVRKSDIVKVRIGFIAGIEVFQILVSVPFAIIGIMINPIPAGNEAGLEANVAFFGLVFAMYALFDIIFLPIFYKTAYKAGVALLWSGSAIILFIAAVEFGLRLLPAVYHFLDTTEPGMMVRQIPVLAGGIGLFALCLWLAFRLSAKNFEKVDI